jgi:hypothetical protein
MELLRLQIERVFYACDLLGRSTMRELNTTDKEHMDDAHRTETLHMVVNLYRSKAAQV